MVSTTLVSSHVQTQGATFMGHGKTSRVRTYFCPFVKRHRSSLKSGARCGKQVPQLPFTQEQLRNTRAIEKVWSTNIYHLSAEYTRMSDILQLLSRLDQEQSSERRARTTVGGLRTTHSILKSAQEILVEVPVQRLVPK